MKRPEQGRFSWADFGMAEEADFLLPLKKPKQISKIRQIFYDNQGNGLVSKLEFV